MPTEAILKEIESLPEEKKQEVFNFVLFLKSNGTTGGKRNLSVKRRLDAFKTDQFFMADDFDETPECFKEYGFIIVPPSVSCS